MTGNGKFLPPIKMVWGTDYYCFTHMEIHSPEIRRRKIGVDSLDHHSRENSEVIGIYPEKKPIFFQWPFGHSPYTAQIPLRRVSLGMRSQGSGCSLQNRTDLKDHTTVTG